MSFSKSSVRFCAWMLAVIFSTVAFAADEPKKEAKPGKEKAKAAVQGYYAFLAKELKLEGDALAKYEAALAARAAALKAWDDANGAKLKELADAGAKAKEGGDKAAAKKAGDDGKPLRDARAKIDDEQKKAVLASLTSEQRQVARGHNYYQGQMNRFSKAELTDDQKAKVKALALEAGKKTNDEMKDADLDKIRDDLAAQVSKDILTEAQRTAVATKGPAKKKPEEPKKPEPPKSQK